MSGSPTRELTSQARARVLFVSHTAEIGGPSHSLLLLIRHLRDRYHTAVLLPNRGPLCEMLADQDIPCFVIPGLHAGTIFKIYRLLRRHRFDLVYGNDANSCERNAMLAAKLARRPFIWHFRSIKWHWKWNKGLYLWCPDDVVAVSQACADSLKRFRRSNSIHVVHNGVELEPFGGNGSDGQNYLAAQLDLQPGARIIISVSHLNPRKGHERSVEVMARIIKQVPNTHLIIVGNQDRNPDYTERIRILSRQHGVEDHIHFLGLRTDIPRLLRGSNIFLHVAKRDPHPRAVLEAMASSLPVVAFAVDGVAETVLDGETGYLAPSGDLEHMTAALLSLINAPDRASAMGRRGRELIQQHFTADTAALRIARIIDRLV